MPFFSASVVVSRVLSIYSCAVPKTLEKESSSNSSSSCIRSSRTMSKASLSSQLSCPAASTTSSTSLSSVASSNFTEVVVNLNVGGKEYCTLLSTLLKHQNSWLARMFGTVATSSAALGASLNSNNISKLDLPKDSEGRYFIDRDGYLFQFVLEFLRNDRIFLPTEFTEFQRLRNEMEFFRLKYKDVNIENGKSIIFKDVIGESGRSLQPEWLDKSRTITLGYQGTFGFGRDGLVDVKFRKLSRILVAGHAGLCRWTFEDQLNDNRDPERFSEDRYSSRFFLKHNNLEQAFESLYEKGFELVGSCGNGTNSGFVEPKATHHVEESRWQHYNEFVFARRPFF